VSAPLPARSLRSAFARSFLVQSSWNYRTMLGSGFAFSILPVLRSLFGDDPARLDAALRRHLDHFNAHPYLADLALGAVIRMEADGEDEETIRRFKSAARGPLGSVGDSLVWASWLPAASLLSLASVWLGAPVWLAVALFVGLYNAGHLALRIWGFRTGLMEGRDVARHLAAAGLGAWTERVRLAAAVLLGVVVGSILAGQGGLAEAGRLWVVLTTVAFASGLLVGHRLWRPTAVVVVSTVAFLATWGWIT
jgi:PTS system mannose-specific IID component